MTDAEILEKLREYFQNQINNLNATEMAEGPFDDGTEYGDAWEAAATVIDRRGGLRIRFEFADTDPTQAAAQQREERAVAEARPHDDEPQPGDIVRVYGPGHKDGVHSTVDQFGGYNGKAEVAAGAARMTIVRRVADRG